MIAMPAPDPPDPTQLAALAAALAPFVGGPVALPTLEAWAAACAAATPHGIAVITGQYGALQLDFERGWIDAVTPMPRYRTPRRPS